MKITYLEKTVSLEAESEAERYQILGLIAAANQVGIRYNTMLSACPGDLINLYLDERIKL